MSLHTLPRRVVRGAVSGAGPASGAVESIAMRDRHHPRTAPTVGSQRLRGRHYARRWAIRALIWSAASLAASLTAILPVSAFCTMFGTMLFMISVDSGITGNGMPYGSIDVVKSRNLME